MNMPRALLSVSDKTGILTLARGLTQRGFELVATGGTARTLTGGGLAVTSVSAVTQFPEMLDGRVKTLHPALHGGILARRDRPHHVAALQQHGIAPIDVVAVNLYPFSDAAARSDTPFEALIEEIDIGGPSLVRAAAKNFRDVLIVVDPLDYDPLLAAIDATPTLAFRFELMRKAFAHTAAYDAAIARTLNTIRVEDERFERTAGSPMPGDRPALDADCIGLRLRKLRDLRYGENPHQRAAWYFCEQNGSDTSVRPEGQTPAPAADVRLLQGRELSFTNLLDLDAAFRIALEFDEPAAVVVKHTNPCGAATGATLAEAYAAARDADSLAAYGGIVALNRAVDAETADAIASTFIEAVIAPAVEEAALPALARKKNMRVLMMGADGRNLGAVEFRSVLNGVLAQERDRVVEARTRWTAASLPEGLRVVTRRQPSESEWEALRFAWRICAHVKSNAVIFTNAHRTLAIGAGQMSRVDAVQMAVMKARSAHVALGGSAAASDAFFPFRDGLDAAAAAGATAVVQPGGSVRDEEVIAAADGRGLAMVFTGRRHFRH
jgi:phosphoribosylaminoimidazolecarboxamide formyltransferase/IMP cyclohydrolase